MDVNGTRFHLIAGEADWAAVRDTTPGGRSSAWHAASASMTLLPDLPLFPRSRRPAGLIAANRRGAASDRYGTWYWIGNDRKTIWRAPAATTRAVLYWQEGNGAQGVGGSTGGLFVEQTPAAEPSDLAGLAVTTHHYLVVGAVTPPGLLIFDLHGGGEPLRLQFPEDAAFAPFDFAAAPDGGVWLLDRENRRLWGLDRLFRLRPLGPAVIVAPEPGSFEPVGGSGGGTPAAPTPQGAPVPANDPVALDVLADGSVLVLDGAPPLGASSSLLHFPLGPDGGLLSSVSVALPDLGGVVAAGDARPVVGYDMAVAPDEGLTTGEGRVLVLESEGNQAISYDLTLVNGAITKIEAQAVYLPLHYFGGRALVAGVMPDGTASAFYDVTPFPDNDRAVRWIRLHAIDLPRYQQEAWLETPPLDGHQPGVTWHRLFLDACIPPETRVTVWTRAGDDVNLLAQQAFVEEPALYLRGRGAELPYWNAFAPDPDGAPLPPGTGTWEVLFQRAHGRWLQVRLVLTGNDRATPRLHRLRAYYPRFSYLRNYLPSAYSDDLLSADFTERLLANMEGFYTDVEGKIAGASALLDPRSAPPETLDWLATWMGLVLDPLWTKVGSANGASLDRRRLMIRFARRLYQRRGTVDGIRFALLLLLDHCLEDTLRRLERATVVTDVALGQELAALGLKYPTLADGEAALEDLLFSYVLASPRRNRVRIVERWEARQGLDHLSLAVLAGDVTEAPANPCAEDGAADSGPVSLDQTITDAAHRFSVLIPEDLPAEEAAMVDKIVGLEKPAHTAYDLRRFWDYFLVGQVRLGLDTVLGEDSRFAPIILGRDALAEGYLESAHPMDVTERAVSDRDLPGQMRL